MKFLKYSLCLVMLLLMGCSTTKINPLKYDSDFIVFGAGGGVSGIEKSTLILDNGEIFELQKMRTTFESKKRIEKERVLQLIASYKELGLENYKINSPGNQYKYIEFHIENSVKRMTWNDSEAREEVLIFYSILQKLAE